MFDLTGLFTFGFNFSQSYKHMELPNNRVANQTEEKWVEVVI